MFDSENRGSGTTDASVHVGTVPDWREIDRSLRRVATARAGLDAEELHWLAHAERAEIHRRFACATILEYVERVLGLGPRVARERLRVARALETLPKLRVELATARLPYSAIRELSRKVTPTTEAAWIAETAGCSLREIEQRLAGYSPGDRPEDPPDPDLATRTISLELTPRTLALFRAASRQIEDEVGHPLDDDELMATLCAGALRDGCAHADTDASSLACGDLSSAGGGTCSLPAPYQIALGLCPGCKRATVDAAGRSFDVPQSTVEQALCNPQYLGRIDAAAPARAARDVPPATVRLVWRRDGGHCVVPGCRSTRHIEVHHIRHRADGGDHSPGNLSCLCFAHHAAHHEGRLGITGTAPDRLVFERIDPLRRAAPR